MEENEKTSIQLLPEKEFEEYPLSKQLTTWIIKVGRLIIIATELIAFSVFIGRIKLDRELTDLTDSLENQLTILENAQDFETDFRDLQERLEIIKDLRQKQIPTNQTLSFLFFLLPSGVELTDLTLQPGNAYLIAKTYSPLSFAQTINNLKNSPRIEKITLTSGRFSSKEGTYNFSLALKLDENNE
jgi:Tfp pilus assembly protein PilN